MGLRRNWRAKVWNVEVKDNYSIAEMSTSKKKEDGTYESDWACKKVLLVGKAREAGVKANDVVYIDDFEVTNKWDAEKKTMYTNYKIHAFADNGGKKKTEEPAKAAAAPVADADDLPFD